MIIYLKLLPSLLGNTCLVDTSPRPTNLSSKMTAPLSEFGQRNTVSTENNGKTPSEDISEKGVVSNNEYAQGQAVSNSKSSDHFPNKTSS